MNLARYLNWLAVLALVLAGDRVLGAGVHGVVLKSQLRFSRLYSGKVHPEVLVVGNSRAVNSLYVPTLESNLGVAVDSLAYNGVTAEVARALALDALDHGAKPKWTIVEVTTVMGEADILKELRLYRRESPRLATLLATNYPDISTASQVSWLFSENTELLMRAGYYARRSDRSWINNYVISDELIEATRRMPPIEFPISPRNNAALRRLADEMEARGIAVCLVLGPYLGVYRSRVSNFDAWATQLRQALGPHSILDLSAAISDRHQFADRIHSNRAGAEAISADVADAIRSGRCGSAVR